MELCVAVEPIDAPQSSLHICASHSCALHIMRDMRCTTYRALCGVRDYAGTLPFSRMNRGRNYQSTPHNPTRTAETSCRIGSGPCGDFSNLNQCFHSTTNLIANLAHE